MKICFFTTSFAEHKQARLAYAEKYFPKDVEIFLITTKPQNKYSLYRTKILEFSESKRDFVFELRRFCQEKKIDLLTNLGTPWESYALFFSTFMLKTKFIINIHSNLLESYSLQKGVFRKFFSFFKSRLIFFPFFFADKIIFGASDQKEDVVNHFPLFKEKIIFLPLILDEKVFFNRGKLKMRKKLNLPIKRDIIIFVGRIQYLKGSDILLKIISKESKKFFILIGNDEEKILSGLNAKNFLHINALSPTDLSEYYSASDLSILPSRTEGFGLVSREALLCETPALVSEITSLKSIPSVIIATNNFKEMLTKINWFFSLEKEQMEKIGKYGRKLIIKETSFLRLKRKYLNLFYYPYKK